MTVTYNAELGGWRVNGRGNYATQALALAAERSAAPAPTTALSSADFKQASSAVMNVKAPTTPESQAVQRLVTLRDALATHRAKKAPAVVIRSVETQIAAVLKQWPAIAQREAAEANRRLDASASKVATIHAAPGGFNAQRSAQVKSATALNNAIAKTSAGKANVDWGLIPMGAAVLGTAVATIATGGVAAGALAGGLSATSALTAGVAIASTAKGIQSLAKGTPDPKTSLAVPGLVQDAGKALGVSIASDRLVAAAELGGELGARASEVVDATRALAAAGNVDAKAALGLLARAAEERVANAIPAGVPQVLTSKGEKALAAYVEQPKLAAAPSSAPSSAPGSVGGLLVLLDTGRLNFSAPAWRPVAASVRGAQRGIVVDDNGRLAFDEYWVPA